MGEQLPAGVPVGYVRITDGLRCRCVRMKIVGNDAYCCGGGREEPTPAAPMRTEDLESAVAQLVPGKPDAEIAAELKDALLGKLEELLPILTACRVAGFVPQFQLGLDPMQRDTILSVHLIKYF
jgi:hypothetical protein